MTHARTRTFWRAPRDTAPLAACATATRGWLAPSGRASRAPSQRRGRARQGRALGCKRRHRRGRAAPPEALPGALRCCPPCRSRRALRQRPSLRVILPPGAA
eukprot:3781755-Prymnesium_polylepis.1